MASLLDEVRGKKNDIREAKERIAPFLSIGLFMITWSIISNLNIFPNLLLPSPLEVAKAAVNEIMTGEVFKSLGNSLIHYSIGLLWGVTLGTSLGLIIGWYKFGESLAEPLIRLLRPIPPLAWLPFAILWMGISHMAAAFLIGLQAFWICLLNTYAGVKSVDRGLIEAVMCFGETSGIGLLKKVVFPASLPFILSAIRISLGQGWLTVIAAELFGIPGVGQRLIEAGMNLAMDVVVVYMAVIGLVYYIIDKGYKALEKHLILWR